jgi:ankyrin repeat protein
MKPNINVKDGYQRTPLHHATMNGHYEVGMKNFLVSFVDH